MQAHWYVVKCKPREEARALEHLERQGYRCFLPIVHVEKLRKGQRIERAESLFPSYLFIHLDDLSDNWYPIRSTRGVSHMVRFNNQAVPLADRIIDGIRERLEKDPPKMPYLKPGERVRITEGSFSNLEAIFCANDGEERVVLLMNILQREQSLSFPIGIVQKCGARDVASAHRA
jgi:transcriptional antiterminator RfaH